MSNLHITNNMGFFFFFFLLQNLLCKLSILSVDLYLSILQIYDSGFGLSLCYVASIIIVAYYFDRRRSFATGISVCGSGVGRND